MIKLAQENTWGKKDKYGVELESVEFYLNPSTILTIHPHHKEEQSFIVYTLSDEKRHVLLMESAESVYEKVMAYKREFPNG